MRRLLSFLLSVSILVLSCNKEGNQDNTPPPINVSTNSLSFGGELNTEDSIFVQSTTSWSVIVKPSTTTWLRLSTASGNGNSKVVVTITERNLGASARTATIYIAPTGSTGSATEISVTQKTLSPLLTTDSSKLTLSASKDVMDSFYLRSNINWKITTSAPWFIVSPVSGSDSTKVYVRTTEENQSSTERTATLTIEPVGSTLLQPISIAVHQQAQRQQNSSIPMLLWSKLYGGSSNEFVHAISATPDGGYILAGSTSSGDGDINGAHGGLDAWILKVDATGVKQWSKVYGGNSNDEAWSVAITKDGGYVFAGNTQSNNGDVNGNKGGYDIWVVKVDGQGNKMWSNTLGGSSADRATAIMVTSDQKIIVAGHTQSTDGDVTNPLGVMDVLLVKLDGAGNKEWSKTYGSADSDEAWCLKETSDGKYLFGGNTASGSNGNSDALIVKVDPSGTVLWSQTYGGTSYEMAWALATTTDGGCVFTGYTGSNNGDVSGNHGANDVWVVKLDAQGAKHWSKTLGGSGDDFGNAIVTTADGGYVLTARTMSSDGDLTGSLSGSDAWLVKLDGSGSKIWTRLFGGSLQDFAESLVRTSNGGYAVGGFTFSGDGDMIGNHGSQDGFIVKVKEQ